MMRTTIRRRTDLVAWMALSRESKDLGEVHKIYRSRDKCHSFEIIRAVAPASSIGGQCKKKNVSRVAMRPKAFVSCGGDGDRKETFLQSRATKTERGYDGFTLVTYHRVSTRMDR